MCHFPIPSFKRKKKYTKALHSSVEITAIVLQVKTRYALIVRKSNRWYPLTVRRLLGDGRDRNDFSHKNAGAELILSTPIPIGSGPLEESLPRVLLDDIRANIAAAKSGPLVRPESASVITQGGIRSCNRTQF